MNWIAQYNDMIAGGAVVVSEKVRRLYAYLVRDMADAESVYEYDERKATKAILFIERYCRHSKGKFGGKPFLLEAWEKALISAIFGIF